MSHGLTSRRWLFAWVIILGFMALAAWTVRDLRFRALSRRITVALTPLAEQGIEAEHYDAAGNFLYAENDYLWEYQGPIVWLIENGYRDPAMLRVMLLCEARRSVDEVYLYPQCFNWDLREHLIAECRSEFPEDPLVAWAIGRCLLAAGEYEQAAIEFLAARVLRFDPAAAGINPEHFLARIITAQLMNGMPEGAVEFARQQAEADDAPVETHRLYADLLCKLEKYEEAVIAADAGLAAFPDDIALLDVKYRSLWWLPDQAAATQFFAAVEERRGQLPVQLEMDSWREWVGQADHGAIASQLDAGAIMAYAALAERYALTGEQENLALIETAIAKRQSTLAAADNAQRSFNPDWVDYAGQELLRAYVLTRQWDKFMAALATTDDPPWDVPRGTYQTAVLLSSIAQTGATPPDANPRWDFQELIEGGTLPYLLYSSHFAAAAEYSGRDVDEVRVEVIQAFMPLRETYHDWTNGELDW